MQSFDHGVSRRSLRGAAIVLSLSLAALGCGDDGSGEDGGATDRGARMDFQIPDASWGDIPSPHPDGEDHADLTTNDGPAGDASFDGPENPADRHLYFDLVLVGDADAAPLPDMVLREDFPITAQHDIRPDEPEVDQDPQVMTAFGNGQQVVTVFSEPIDPATGAQPGNYTLRSTSGNVITIQSVRVDGQFAYCTIDFSQVNPDYTYYIYVERVNDLTGNVVDPANNKAEVKARLYLNIVWNQHQPLYYDPVKDEMAGPWVRKHSTKDYYDMASILKNYREVHLTMNLTSVLLTQLQTYIDRLGPYVDTVNNTVDEAAFLARWEGHTDPWVDLLLKDTPSPANVTETELNLLWKGAWSCVSTADALMWHFPEYEELRDANRALYTQEDFLALKAWFEIAWFDPDFLKGPVTMPDGTVVDLTDILDYHPSSDTFTLSQPITEEMCNRLVAENYKIMKNTVPIHKEIMYHVDSKKGQIELVTTPFYHPILPLVHNTDLARLGLPDATLPSPAFSYPEDAWAQVAKAVKFYTDTFGMPPSGMWPGEGAVAEEVITHFTANGIRWVATGPGVLERSTPPNQSIMFPYRVDTDTQNGPGGPDNESLLIVFRDQVLSDQLAGRVQGMPGVDGAMLYITEITSRAPRFGSPDQLLTIIVDGENPWEGFYRDHDGKTFLHTLYSQLQSLFEAGLVIPVAMSEYIDGNQPRGIPPHPIIEQSELEPLFAGTWIEPNYQIWIGEAEENQCWSYLAQARADLRDTGLPRPNPMITPPTEDEDPYAYYVYHAWEEIYAAEGSDWFWWFGDDMETPAHDDTPFDQGFRAHLTGMYTFARLAGANLPEVEFAPCVQPKGHPPITFTEPPTIDGAFIPTESEWSTEGSFVYDNDSGGQLSPDDDIAVLYYGFDDDNIYVALSSNEDLTSHLGEEYAISVYVTHKHIVSLERSAFEEDPANDATPNGTALNFNGFDGAAREVRVDFSGPAAVVRIMEADGRGGWSEAGPNSVELGGPVGVGKILEIRIPLTDLNLQGPNPDTPDSPGDPLQAIVVASDSGRDVDMVPNSVPVVLFQDESTLVNVIFQVDVSGGSGIAINTYGEIRNPPPPQGNGLVFIAGDLPELGAESGAQGLSWVPCKITMRDDGQYPDNAWPSESPGSGDRVWSHQIRVPPGTSILYKYQIGTPSDQGNWSGTEEYPMTERKLDITDTDGNRRMIIKDIFADRPQPARTVAPNSVIIDE